MNDTTKPFITETFAQAAQRVPELATLADKAISETLAQGMELVDTIPGYSLMQYVSSAGTQPSLFVFRATTLPEASPATKGQCNDERACGACFSGQGQCETEAPATQLTPTDVRWAEDLIRQLPADHEGRNSWLLNFGSAAPDARPNASAEA
jgi:hypothetical protein